MAVTVHARIVGRARLMKEAGRSYKNNLIRTQDGYNVTVGEEQEKQGP